MILTTLVIVSLLIVNTRAAYYFVAGPGVAARRRARPGDAPAPRRPGAAPAGYTVRVGAASSRPSRRRSIEPGIDDERCRWRGRPVRSRRARLVARRPPRRGPQVAVPSGAPARIGATIGALERLLIVAFMLTGAEAAVGFVIAAKTIARFKQLDDRGFAEYYLLGTLASVAVAISTSLVALAVLATLP